MHGTRRNQSKVDFVRTRAIAHLDIAAQTELHSNELLDRRFLPVRQCDSSGIPGRWEISANASKHGVERGSQTSASIHEAGRATERDAAWKARESERAVCKARGRCRERSEARWRLQEPSPGEACARARECLLRASRSRMSRATVSSITRRKPSNSAVISRVTSSVVGPRPPCDQ